MVHLFYIDMNVFTLLYDVPLVIVPSIPSRGIPLILTVQKRSNLTSTDKLFYFIPYCNTFIGGMTMVVMKLAIIFHVCIGWILRFSELGDKVFLLCFLQNPGPWGIERDIPRELGRPMFLG